MNLVKMVGGNILWKALNFLIFLYRQVVLDSPLPPFIIIYIILTWNVENSGKIFLSLNKPCKRGG